MQKDPSICPQGVTATVAANTVKVKGAKGELSLAVADGVTVEQKDKKLQVEYSRATAAACPAGATRAHLANMVTGVSKGYETKLELVGVGYRAAVQGKVLNLTLGFSHAGEFPDSGWHLDGDAEPDRNHHQGHRPPEDRPGVPPKIRDIRPPEPYKGKGVRYAGEQIDPEGGQEEVILRHSYADHQERAAPAPRHQDPREDPRAGRRPPHGASHAAAHLRAGVRCAGRKVLAAASTVQEKVAKGLKGTGNVEAAKAVGTRDRRARQGRGRHQGRVRSLGFQYHGRVKALADAAREAGLEF